VRSSGMDGGAAEVGGRRTWGNERTEASGFETFSST